LYLSGRRITRKVLVIEPGKWDFEPSLAVAFLLTWYAIISIVEKETK